jgi:hypothetical protein
MRAEAVSIARFGPRWLRFAGARYPALAPTPSMLKLPAADFDVAYARQLEVLDPQRVHSELVALAGRDAILLCHEKPEIGFTCHRLNVARWLETALGVAVPELAAPLRTGRSSAHRLPARPSADEPEAVTAYLRRQLRLDL